MPQVPPPQHFSIESQQYGDTILVRLSGEFDLATERHFERTVEALSMDARSLVLDLSDVTFIDSSGIRSLLRAWKRAHSDGHDLVVVPGTDQVRQTMELTGVDSVLPIAEEIPDMRVGIAGS